jgi:hypothetical protein
MSSRDRAVVVTWRIATGLLLLASAILIFSGSRTGYLLWFVFFPLLWLGEAVAYVRRRRGRDPGAAA